MPAKRSLPACLAAASVAAMIGASGALAQVRTPSATDDARTAITPPRGDARQRAVESRTLDARADTAAADTPLADALAEPPGPTAIAGEEEDDVLDAPAGDAFAPPGFRVGSFLLFPRIEVGAEYTDNVFLTATGRQSDRAAFVAPGLEWRSVWSRHELSGEVKARNSYHDRFSSEDDRDFTALLRGRLDISSRSKLESELDHSRSQEDRDSVGFPSGATGRANVVTDRAWLQGSHRFNRLTVSLRGSVRQDDYSEASGDGTAPGSERDNTLREIGSRASYEFRPGVAAFVDWRGNERDFRQPMRDDGTLRGSTGHAVQAGLAFTLSGKLEGEASAGFARQRPDDPGDDTVEGFIFNANLAWRPSALTTVRLGAASEIDETSIDSASVFVRTYSVGVEHALRRNLLVGAAFAHTRETDTDTDDVKNRWKTSLSAEYLLNRWVGIKGEYVHTRSSGEDEGDDYTENAVTVGVTLRR